MKFIILFEDAVDAEPDTRTRHMAAHLAFLERNAHRIEAAGPLTDPDHSGRDGLWIMDVEDRGEAEGLIREDPFWPTGLRASFAVIPWTQVFADGRRMIDA